jgi:hypothetical protein
MQGRSLSQIARCNQTEAVISGRLSATDGVDYLHLVTFVQLTGRKLTTGHDLEIDLNGDTFAREFAGLDQGFQCRTMVTFEGLAVENNIHLQKYRVRKSEL